MSVAIQMTKEEVLARLREQLAIAKAHDKVVAAKHKEDEKAWFKNFKEALKMASTWDYSKARSHIRYRGEVSLPIGQAPECPMSQTVAIQRAIDRVSMSNLKVYKMSGDRNLAHGDLYALLVWEPDPPRADVC